MKNIVKIAAVIAVVLIALFIFSGNSTSVEVTFENNSGETTTDFFLYFPSATTPTSVANISPNDTYVEKMIYKESADSDSLRLFYHDYTGIKQDILLIDSFEKGYKGQIKIDIVDIDENGVYTFELIK